MLVTHALYLLFSFYLLSLKTWSAHTKTTKVWTNLISWQNQSKEAKAKFFFSVKPLCQKVGKLPLPHI
jgi:hypothetical protein